MPERSASRTQRHSYGLKSGAYFAVRCLRTRRRNRFSRTAQTVEVKFNGVVHFAFDAVSRLARGDAAGEIGRIGGIAGRSFFNDDQVPAHFDPACLRILFCVGPVKVRLGEGAKTSTRGRVRSPDRSTAATRAKELSESISIYERRSTRWT